MDWNRFARWEWLLIELLVLGLAIAELISVNRLVRKDRATKAAAPEHADSPGDGRD